MSLPTSNEDWSSLIRQIKASLPSPIPISTRPVPEPASIAQTIDHTQLSLSATQSDIDALCAEARQYNFAAVCVRANYVSRAVQNLEGTSIGVACVVGFHEGTHSTAEKVSEAKEAVQKGANELDMVMNYPLLKEGRYMEVFEDIFAVRNAARDVRLKVILETSQLSKDEIIAGCVVSCLAGADYVKTSTGFNGPGASAENVALMRAVCDLVNKHVKVKASGGVRTAEDCVRMIQAGAERIGASAGVKILEDATQGRRHLDEAPTLKRKTSHDTNLEANVDKLDTSKPTAVFKPQGGRSHSLSIALPGSIVANAKSHDQKTYLVGSIARALAVFCVDEIVIFDDEPRAQPSENAQPSKNEYTAFSDPSHFLAHVLSYLETPPHLRRDLFPMHPNLRTAGTLPSLDMPHHIRANEWSEYREGVTIPGEHHGADETASARNKTKKKKKSKIRQHEEEEDHNDKDLFTLVNVGLPEPVRIPDISIPPHTRLTLKFKSHNPSDGAHPVAPSAPREEAGYYWGYSIRRCCSLSSVFTECPFDGGYDLSFGTSERGEPLADVLRRQEEIPQYRHLLLVFGGVAGLETAAKADGELVERGIGPGEVGGLFDYWVNVLPGQGSRTIRTEEAVWLGLMGLREVIVAKGM
ncbi:hypothetical protein PRK78_003018 [Emydomyces testavorans]|uniref:deoxyribose-phosphate aldolase n=1 Tax=Emydomyces testavorans TaxID=2070801 RepID=A0AAF0IID2_9EURO|nr:hypothetical protein PRK78_003018 [Emydomyces testavorans]